MGCCDFSINNPQNSCLVTWLLTWNITFWVKYSIKKIGWLFITFIFLIFILSKSIKAVWSFSILSKVDMANNCYLEIFLRLATGNFLPFGLPNGKQFSISNVIFFTFANGYFFAISSFVTIYKVTSTVSNAGSAGIGGFQLEFVSIS